jgi:hypothetical protein
MFIAPGEVQRQHARNAYSSTEAVVARLHDISRYLSSLFCAIPTGVHLCVILSGVRGVEGPRIPAARPGHLPNRQNCM